jgi:hypothetical protein
MNPNKQQSVMFGGFLIALGLVWWLNLWWVLLPGLLIAGGVIGYRQRRSLGRPIEAVQAGLWCIGLALLFLIGGIWPGVLLLAGVSILIRGRELQVDDRLQSLFAQARSRRVASPPVTTQQVPITTVQMPTATTPPQFSAPTTNTGDTTRLHE